MATTTVEEWTYTGPRNESADDLRPTYNFGALEGCTVEWPGSGGPWKVGPFVGKTAANRPMWSCISPHSGATINVAVPSRAVLVGGVEQVMVELFGRPEDRGLLYGRVINRKGTSYTHG